MARRRVATMQCKEVGNGGPARAALRSRAY